MPAIKICPICRKSVVPKKDFNWLWFFILGPFYLIYHLFFKHKHCPICNYKF
jgi:hypothetical protein